MKLPPAQPSLFEAATAVEALADWGTPEQHQRARALMLNLGERWGDRYAGQETLTEEEWQMRRIGAARRAFFDGEEWKFARPIITPQEEREFRDLERSKEELD